MVESSPLRLREDVALELVYDDRTPFGSGVTGLCDALLGRSCAALRTVVARVGLDGLQGQAARWMPHVMAPHALGRLYARPETLREECVYPPAEAVTPVALRISVPDGAGGHRTTSQPLRSGLGASLGPWMGAWQRGATRPRTAAAASAWDRLLEHGALEAPGEPRQPLDDGVTLVGHATVAVQSQGTQLLFDPFLLPPSIEDPPGIRPHTPCDLRPDAVFITHGHPDHFDVATLLRLGHDRPIFVPAVPRESLLATDMVHRLRELGFTQVRPLTWGEEVQVGCFRVIALPFYGEQPTDGRMLHPEARNLGNTYVVEGLGRRLALLADAGCDAAGSTLDLAADARRRYGALDLLLGGYRAWRVQPIRYLFSSVARYLLFVPPEQRTRWQKIMNDADDLVATGAAWGARAVVPYANGGAPWFARIGLGPSDLAGSGVDDPSVDPPAAAVDESLRRAGHPGLRLLDLRAGQCVDLFGAGARS